MKISIGEDTTRPFDRSIVADVFPWPKTIDETVDFLRLANEQYTDEGRNWKIIKFDYFFISDLYNERILLPNDKNYYRLNLHILKRGMHQLNEACNRQWAISELLGHILSEDCPQYGPRFKMDFLVSTIYPRLYYSLLSTMLSNMSFFGCTSIKDKIKGKERDANLVRASNGLIFVSRRKFIRDLFCERDPGRWHDNIMMMYESYLENGYEIPEINMKIARRLKEWRHIYDYQILGHSQMQKLIPLNDVFPDWKFVTDKILQTVKLYERYDSDYLRGCDVRFLECAANIEEILERYE